MIKRKPCLFFLSFLLLAASGLVTCILAHRKAFLRREVAVQSSEITPFAFWGIIICIAAWVVFLIVWCVFFDMLQKKEIATVTQVFTLFGILTLGLVVLNCVALKSHSEAYLRSDRVPYFTDISLLELENLDEKGFTGAIYVEREGCILCDKAREELETFLEKEYKYMFRYDTSHDRDRDYNKMLDVIGKYGVKNVPAIIIMKKGDIVTTLTYGEIMDGTALRFIV